MLQIGSLVDNKYKILSEVGHGGMSVVYLAINERANKTWAVKEVRKDGVCDFEAVKQGLVVETDMLKRLDHPFLPSIIDVIDTEDSFLIVMDYIEGKSLQSVLKHNGAQPQEQVVKWAIQLCDVLGYLHSRTPAIIYRDMKPANVMLKPNGDITLIDFGTAREFKNRTKVEDTTCLGTRGYAAPEQFGGRGETDPRTDIYCLGATMYHLITGHSPAEPPYEIKPLSYWDPAYYGTGLEQIITKCCQQDPEHRYQSCAELMYDLENVGLLDLETQRKRNQKWAAFIASIAMCAVGLVGVLGFSLAKNAAMEQSYDQYLKDAAMSADFASFSESIQEAVAVDPGKYEAYDMLLSRVEEDGKFDTQTEWAAIYTCLNSKKEGTSSSYDSYLLSESPADYGNIMYRIGKLYFLMGEGTDANLKSSVVYFDNALNEGGMKDATDSAVVQKANIAASLMEIGSSIDSLKTIYTEKTYSYTDLYESLEGLVNNYSIESLGSKQYGIALYNRVANMLSKYYVDIVNEKSDDADEANRIARMSELLNKIESELKQTEQQLSSTEKNLGLGDLITKALNNVTTARQNINALSGGAG